MDFLEKLILETTGGNKKKFAELVGTLGQNIKVQLESNKQLYYATEYAKLLGIKKLSGTQNGCYIEIEIKKIESDVEIKNGKWTFNGKSFEELNAKEKIELNEFFKNQK
jgi:hypothetical protein